LAPYRPWNDQGVADPWEFADDIEQGYRDMHDLLVRGRTKLLAEDGPLMAFLDLPVRFIRRSTPEYYQILRTSLHPCALINGATRDALLAALFSVVFRNDPPAPGELAITNGEVNALRQLDVPTFTTVTTSTSLFAGSSVDVPGHFQDTADRYVRRGIANLDGVGLETDVRFLRTAIDAARGGLEGPLHSNLSLSVGSVPSALSVGEAAEAADRIAALVRDARETPLGIGRGWLGLSWSPIQDRWEIGLAGHDLCGGALGSVMFLAAHSSVRGNSQSASVCLETLDDLFNAKALAGLGNGNGLMAPESWQCGLAGPGAVAYVASYAAAWLAQPELAVAAGELWLATESETEGNDVHRDQPFGLAEVLLQFLRWRRFGNPSSSAMDAMALRWAHTLLKASGMRKASCAASERLADWFPVEADKIVLALATFLSQYPNQSLRADVERAIGAHRFDLNRRGGRLAAMVVSRLVGPSAPTGYRLPPVNRHAMGSRALLQRIEEAQLAAKYFGHGDAIDESSRCLRILIGRKAETGRWFPDRLADDSLNLSALDGTPALGLALLRHIQPDIPALGILE
jgi:lantibiotic modifying enzyme